MSSVFESAFLNEYFANELGKENFSLEDLKLVKRMQIVNPNLDEIIRITEKDLQTICSLGCKNIYFDGLDLGNAILPEMTLECLELANCKVGECDFSKVKVEEAILLYGDNGFKNNRLNQFTSMSHVQVLVCIDCKNLDLSEISNLKNLKQLQIRGEVANYYGIQNLKQLRDVTISGKKGVEKYLPITDTLETIEIEDDELTDIGFLKNYPNLKEVVLQESKLDESQMPTICELKRKGATVSFNQSLLQEQLTQRKYEIEEDKIHEIKRVLGLSDDVEINDYNIFKLKQGRTIRLEIESVNILNEMLSSGLLSDAGALSKMNVIEGIDLVVENLEEMSPQLIEYISKSKDKNFRFVVRTLNGLDSKILEILDGNGANIEFYIKGDCYHYINISEGFVPVYECKHLSFQNLDDLEPYKIQDIREIISVLEPIREQTMATDSDLEKFSIIRKIAILSEEYYYSGIKGAEINDIKRQIMTRSLKGIFMDGKAVCAGKSLGFLIMSEYVGLSARDVSGRSVENKEVQHAWNQIKLIDDEGEANWYNVDITNDPDIIDKKDKFILASDEEFYKKYEPDEFEKVEECPNNLPNKYVHQASFNRTLIVGGGLNKILDTERRFDNLAYDGMYSGRKITPADINNMLKSLTLSEMRYCIDMLEKTMKSKELKSGKREDLEDK